MSARTDTYARPVERGCLCGTDNVADCPVHTKPGDNRGIRAFFEAGMPRGFPTTASCASCGADSLLYPSAELDRGDVPAGQSPRSTLVCPNCSTPAVESFLRYQAEGRHELNENCVFTTATRLLVLRRGDQVREARLGDDPGPGWEPVVDRDVYLQALDALEAGA